MNTILEAIMVMAREANVIITVESGSKARKNLMEGIIMETVMILETVFKRG